MYRSLNPLILRYLRHHVGAAAEDIAAEVWLCVAGRLPQFEGSEDDFRALLFTIARRRAVDHHRQAARRVATTELRDDLDGFGMTFEDDVVARITAQGAVEMLARHLPAEQAEIVLLRVLGGFDVAHVAAIVGKNAGAVRVAQHRALQRLQEVFAREGVTP